METILSELNRATRQSFPTERLPARADLAVMQFYEALFSDCARDLYHETHTPIFSTSIKSCLPLLKKYHQSEDGLSPSEFGYRENKHAFALLQSARLIEFVRAGDEQKEEEKWQLTGLGYTCVETLLAEERFEQMMRRGTTSLSKW